MDQDERPVKSKAGKAAAKKKKKPSESQGLGAETEVDGMDDDDDEGPVDDSMEVRVPLRTASGRLSRGAAARNGRAPSESGKKKGRKGTIADSSNGTAPPTIVKVTPASTSTKPAASSASVTLSMELPPSNLSNREKRKNHIVSEQRRRDTVKESFATLTALLSIPPSYRLCLPLLPSEEGSLTPTSVEPPSSSNAMEGSTFDSETANGAAAAAVESLEPISEMSSRRLDKDALAAMVVGKQLKGAKKAPGPGKGPSKASVLGKAVGLVRWLDRGNEWLEEEIERLEHSR